MFSHLPPANRALGRLAEHLYEELRTFGRLASTDNLTEESLNQDLKRRWGFTLSLLQGLEQFAGLRFDPVHSVPFCGMPGDWPDDVPPAGYTSTAPAPLPSQAAASQMNCWVYEAAQGSVPLWPLKAVLYYIAEHGYEAGLALLFDLYDTGFLSSRGLGVFSRFLARGRAQVGSDEELIRRFHSDTPRPSSPREWLTVDLNTDWFTQQPVAAQGLGTLVERVWDAVGDIRNSQNLDAWVVNGARLFGLVRAVNRLIDLTGSQLPPSVRVSISRLEEAAADSFAMRGVMALGLSDGIIATVVGHAASTSQSSHTDLGTNRSSKQRPLIPPGLPEAILYGESAALPPQWQALSWRVIYPWAALFERGRSLWTLPGGLRHLKDIARLTNVSARPPASPVGQARDDEFFATFETVAELSGAGRYAEAIELSSSSLLVYPYAAPMYGELAIAFDECGDREQALENMIISVALEPDNPLGWQSLTVILDRLGHHEEASMSHRVRIALEADSQSSAEGNLAGAPNGRRPVTDV